MAFQCTFAAITPALIVGAFAERMKFSAVLLFMVLWFTFSYLPIAHMVWYWAGPGCVSPTPSRRRHGDRQRRLAVAERRDRLRRRHGRAHQRRHRRAGRCLVLGKRMGYGKEADAAAQPDDDHDRRLAAVGGLVRLQRRLQPRSQRHAPRMAFCNTHFATAAAALAWMFGEWIFQGQAHDAGRRFRRGRWPGCDYAGLRLRRPMGAIVLGIVAGLVCLWAVVGLKSMFGYDDSLDVFGVHCIGGIIGALGTGIVRCARASAAPVSTTTSPTRSATTIMGAQVISQLWAWCTIADLVGRGSLHRLQDRRCRDRPARDRRAGARRPGRDSARRTRVQHVRLRAQPRFRASGGRPRGARLLLQPYCIERGVLSTTEVST